MLAYTVERQTWNFDTWWVLELSTLDFEQAEKEAHRLANEHGFGYSRIKTWQDGKIINSVEIRAEGQEG